MIFKGNKKMKKSLLLLICVLPVFTAASSHHTLSYELDDKDVDCMIWAGLRIDLQGRCYDDAIYAMKQKIIKSGKMNKAQITHYLKPYKERCIKQAIKDETIENRHYDEYGSYYVCERRILLMGGFIQFVSR